jgi:hypothetical protein
MASEKQILRKITEDSNYFKEIPKNLKNEKICLKAVSYDWTLLEFVENQTDNICIKAINGNYQAIKYVRNQTLNICIAAVKKNFNSIRFITNKSIEIYKELFKKDICEKIFMLIKDPSKEIIIEFIKACPNALNKKYIKEIDHTIELYNIAVRHQGLSIRYIKDRTPEMCLEAVKTDFKALQYIVDQTEEMCLIAVKANSFELGNFFTEHIKGKNIVFDYEINRDIRFDTYYEPRNHILSDVKNQTEKICLEAVKYYGLSLQHVKNKTHEICMVAVNNIGHAIAFVENQTEDICLAAVNNCGFAIRFIKKDNRSEEICLAAVKKNGLALNYIHNHTHEICYAAVNQNGLALEHVSEDMLNEDMYLDAVRQNGMALEFINIDNQNEDICNEALKSNINAIKFVKKNIDYDLALKAIRNDVMNLQYIPYAHADIINEAFNKDHNVIKYIKKYNQTEEMCLKAIQHDIDLIQYVHFNIPNDLAIKAVTKNGIYLKNIINQTDEIVKIALEKTIDAFKYVKNITPLMCLDIVNKDGLQLEHIKMRILKPEWNDFRDLIYMEAIKQNPLAIKFAICQTLKHRQEAIKNNPDYAKYFIFNKIDSIYVENFENDDVCPICLDKHNEDNRIISLKACKHNYHLKCLTDFHKHSADRKCCKCRKNLFQHN